MQRAAVIILSYLNKEALADLARLLPTLEAVEYPKERWEIIIVDNPSPLGNCREYLDREWVPKSGKTLPKLTVVKSEINTGFTGGNNLGVRLAREHGCDFVYLLNQDTDVDPRFLHAALDRAEREPTVGVVQSLLLLGKEPDRVNSWGNAFHFLGYGYCGGYRRTRAEAKEHFAAEKERGNEGFEVPTASGAASLVRLAALGDAELFDEKFFLYHEDIDLSLRVRLAGYRVVIEPKSIVRHHYVFARSVSKFRWMERNRFVVLLSFYRWPTLLLIALPLLGAELFSLIFAANGGWFSEKIGAYKSLFAADTRRWIGERRRRIQTGRRLTDRELLKNAASRILFQESEAGGFIMTRIANPLMAAVWAVVFFLVRW